jgi:tryptophan 2,3-dioxygenase
MEQQPVYYGEYLQLDKIINAQAPESFKEGHTPAHDEMLFIIIHQAYELWFKQILFEIDAIAAAMEKPTLNDNSNEMQSVVQRLNRIATIMNVLVHQVDILETMTPMDFLEFRDLLRPASGFQSWQFKIIEAKLGLKFEHRHGQSYYTSQLKQEDIDRIKTVEQGSSLLQLVNSWLERMPFLKDESVWQQISPASSHHFWNSFEQIYSNSLNETEKNNVDLFKKVFYETDGVPERSLSAEACRSALFIMLYRGYPILEMPFQILELLLEIDHQMGNWRYRHINMVRRMIGTRTGTGGSTGSGYLQGAMDKHYIFKEISQLNSFLIDKRKLPQLPEALVQKLGYHF